MSKIIGLLPGQTLSEYCLHFKIGFYDFILISLYSQKEKEWYQGLITCLFAHECKKRFFGGGAIDLNGKKQSNMCRKGQKGLVGWL